MTTHHTYKPIRFKWTPAEQRVFELLSMRRYAELAEFCQKLIAAEESGSDKHIWR